MLTLKILGAIDIIGAIIIFFNLYEVHWIIVAVHVTVLLLKGIAGLMADIIGFIYGMVDILAAIFIAFAIIGFLPVKIVIILVLLFKGAFSMV